MTNQIGTVLPGSRSSEAPFVFGHAVVAHANRGQRDGDGKKNLTSDPDDSGASSSTRVWRARTWRCLALGIGSLGYPRFWLLSGLRAPCMGGPGAAKDSLQWLAVPSSGLCLIGLVAVIVLTGRALFTKPLGHAS